MYIRESKESFIKKALVNVFSPSHSRTFAILAFLILSAIIPFTVKVAQQRQETRQQATGSCTSELGPYYGNCTSSGSGNTVCGQRSLECSNAYSCIPQFNSPGSPSTYKCVSDGNKPISLTCSDNSACASDSFCNTTKGLPGKCTYSALIAGCVGKSIGYDCAVGQGAGTCQWGINMFGGKKICSLNQPPPQEKPQVPQNQNPPTDNTSNTSTNQTCTETSKSPYYQCGGALCGSQGVVGTANDSVKVIEKDCNGTLNYTCNVEQACTNGCDPATGLCKSAQASDCKDNPATPPPGYKWTALCDRSCKYNTDCPLGADQHLGWCYGFPNSGLKCLQLEKLDSGTGGVGLSCTLALDTSRTDNVTNNKILATVRPNGLVPSNATIECLLNGEIKRTNTATANYCDIKGLQPNTSYLLSARYMNGTTQIGKCTNSLTVITDKFPGQKISPSPTFTPTATPSPTPKESQTVTKTRVISPNGGENWSKGKVYGIKWNYVSDRDPNEPIPTSISLKKINGNIETKTLSIADKNGFSVPGTNIYYWIIPETIETGSYKIEVFVHSQSSSWESDISDNSFSIIPSSETPFEGVKLTSPIGGELIRAGEIFPIKWEYRSSTALKDGIPTVILLQKYDGRFTDILTIANVKTLEGENLFNWTVPMLETGMNYRLLIKFNRETQGLNFIFKQALAQTSESAGSFGNFAILGESKISAPASPTPAGSTGKTADSAKGCTDTDFGCIPNDPIGFVSKFYGIGLGFVGGVALLFIILGGYLILSSQGNTEQLNKGKTYIIYSILGLLLAIFGFALMEIIAGVFKIPGL